MTTNIKSLTIGEILALNHTLVGYPMAYGLDTIFTMIHLGDEHVEVNEHFEKWDTDTLFNFVKGLAIDIDKEIALAMR